MIGEQVDTLLMSKRTVKKVKKSYFEAIEAGFHCTKDGCLYTNATKDRLKIHCLSHRIIYASECGFLSSSRDSVLKHKRNFYHDATTPIYQKDRRRWRMLVKLIPNLLEVCPAMPLQARDYPLCSQSNPLFLAFTTVTVMRKDLVFTYD